MVDLCQPSLHVVLPLQTSQLSVLFRTSLLTPTGPLIPNQTDTDLLPSGTVAHHLPILGGVRSGWGTCVLHAVHGVHAY